MWSVKGREFFTGHFTADIQPAGKSVFDYFTVAVLEPLLHQRFVVVILGGPLFFFFLTMAYGSPNDGEQVRDRQHAPPPTERTNLLSDEGRCSLYKTISVSISNQSHREKNTTCCKAESRLTFHSAAVTLSFSHRTTAMSNSRTANMPAAAPKVHGRHYQSYS
jgi:hypothetical protein